MGGSILQLFGPGWYEAEVQTPLLTNSIFTVFLSVFLLPKFGEVLIYHATFFSSDFVELRCEISSPITLNKNDTNLIRNNRDVVVLPLLSIFIDHCGQLVNRSVGRGEDLFF